MLRRMQDATNFQEQMFERKPSLPCSSTKKIKKVGGLSKRDSLQQFINKYFIGSSQWHPLLQ